MQIVRPFHHPTEKKTKNFHLMQCSINQWRIYKSKNNVANLTNDTIWCLFSMLAKCVFELCYTKKKPLKCDSWIGSFIDVTVQMNELIQISKDTVDLDRTHSGKIFHRRFKTNFHYFQTFQMSSFGVNQLVDGRLKFPFTSLIKNLKKIRPNKLG